MNAPEVRRRVRTVNESADRSGPDAPHASDGLYALLQSPLIYSGLLKLLARKDTRCVIAEEYIRARRGDHVVDVGCGPGTMLPYLGAVHYTGFDLNQAYIEYAQKTYGGRGEFFQCRVDDAKARLTSEVDIVIAIAVLHHLDDAEARALIATAYRILKPGGRLITFDAVFTSPQNPIAQMLIRLDRGKSVRTEQGYRALTADCFEQVKVDIRTDLLRVPYTHCITVCTK